MFLRQSDQDTIAAIATPAGEGGLGIVRLSGKDSIRIADCVFQAKSGIRITDQKSHTAQYGCVVSKENTDDAIRVLDEGLLLLMRAPKSYTAEDVVEIQIHGGNVVLREVLSLVIRHGARLAGHGEFTQRAFLNGRIDLLQAEAVLDLIQAKTQKSRQWASAQLEGSLSRKSQRMKECLLEILSHLEVSIDFPDEDLKAEDYSQIKEKLTSLESQINDLLRGSELGMLAKRGVRVALWGRPNTGKSSLMNCLVKHNRVIVTPIPGTTRDVVEEEIQMGGFPVRILDTAGIQETHQVIEKEGIERSRKAMRGADLVLFVIDKSEPFGAEDSMLLDEIQDKAKIVVFNKIDLARALDPMAPLNLHCPVAEISCRTEEGLQELEKTIIQWILHGNLDVPDESVISSVRQKDVIEKMQASIQTALGACQSGLSPELVAVDVRFALDCLGALVGEIVTDDVLEVMFSKFCIGK